MNKTVIHIFISLWLTLFVVNVFALTTDQKGQIIKNFERLEYEMIFESDGIFLSEDDKEILSTSRKLNIYSSI